MATVTKGRTFVSGEVVTPTKLNTLVDSATVTGIVDADVSASAAIADTKLATISTPGKVSGNAITSGTIGGSTAINTTGTITSGTITANLTGNASTATLLQTARTIAISGDVTGTATSFNGGANISIASAITADSIVNADINSAAAIADTKLATIATAGKVSGSAITSGNISTSGNITTSGSVSAATFAGAGASFLVPTGAVMPFAMNAAPSGWLAADGTAVSRSTYATLWTALGTTYGAGDGSTTFNLPDLRGYFVRGAGTNSDGTASASFGVKQADELMSHSHTFTRYNVLSPRVGGAGSTGNFWSDTNSNISTGSTGGTETRPRNIAMLYCIKF